MLGYHSLLLLLVAWIGTVPTEAWPGVLRRFLAQHGGGTDWTKEAQLNLSRFESRLLRHTLTKLNSSHIQGIVPMDLFDPVVTCPPPSKLMRLDPGGPVERPAKWEDGAKWMCVPFPRTARPGCVVLSFGSNDQFEFERAALNMTPCTIHTFDCTAGMLGNATMFESIDPERHAFHPYCVGSQEMVAANPTQVVNWEGLLRVVRPLGLMTVRQSDGRRRLRQSGEAAVAAAEDAVDDSESRLQGDGYDYDEIAEEDGGDEGEDGGWQDVDGDLSELAGYGREALPWSALQRGGDERQWQQQQPADPNEIVVSEGVLRRGVDASKAAVSHRRERRRSRKSNSDPGGAGGSSNSGSASGGSRRSDGGGEGSGVGGRDDSSLIARRRLYRAGLWGGSGSASTQRRTRRRTEAGPEVFVLKIDVEGFEWQLLSEWGPNTPGLPAFLAIEIHNWMETYVVPPPPPPGVAATAPPPPPVKQRGLYWWLWGKHAAKRAERAAWVAQQKMLKEVWARRQRVYAGELSLMFLHLARLGYAVVAREDNPNGDINARLCCAEFLLIRVRGPEVGRPGMWDWTHWFTSFKDMVLSGVSATDGSRRQQ